MIQYSLCVLYKSLLNNDVKYDDWYRKMKIPINLETLFWCGNSMRMWKCNSLLWYRMENIRWTFHENNPTNMVKWWKLTPSRAINVVPNSRHYSNDMISHGATSLCAFSFRIFEISRELQLNEETLYLLLLIIIYIVMKPN